MIIRKTTHGDIQAAADIYDMARSFMRKTGNTEQWSSGHPNREDIINDMAMGSSYVCEDKGEVVGVFFFNVGNDPTYDKIYDGEWKKDGEYAVIHRVAVKYNGRGIADNIYSFCFTAHPNLRIDTHKDNLPMQRSLTKNGFEYCGIIYLADGNERLAFQKSIKKERF